MKSLISIFVFLLVSVCGMAQEITYQTFIYTSDDLSDEIARQSEERDTRGYMGDLFNAALDA